MHGAEILVGIDFSESSDVALSEARTLALRLDLAVTAVHVARENASDEWTPAPAEAAWLRLAGVSRDQLVVRRGLPWVELVRAAGERGAAMIVAGSHGRSGFQPVALGSTAARLAVLSPRPVLLVGPRAVRTTHRERAGAAFGPGEGLGE